MFTLGGIVRFTVGAVEDEVPKLLDAACLSRRHLRRSFSGIGRSRPADVVGGGRRRRRALGIPTEEDAPVGPGRGLVLSRAPLDLVVAVLAHAVASRWASPCSRCLRCCASRSCPHDWTAASTSTLRGGEKTGGR